MIQEIIAKLQFWYAERCVELDVDYEFKIDLENPSDIAIVLLKKFPNTVVQFSNINFDGSMLNFDMTVVSNPNNFDTTSKKFKKFTSNVFRNIIISSIKADRNENRNVDTHQSNQERKVHEESDTVLEERVFTRKPRKKAVRRNKGIHPEV